MLRCKIDPDKAGFFKTILQKVLDKLINNVFEVVEEIEYKDIYEEVFEIKEIYSIFDIPINKRTGISIFKLNALNAYMAKVEYLEIGGMQYTVTNFILDAGVLQLTPEFYAERLIERLRKNFSLKMAIRYVELEYRDRDAFTYSKK